MSGVTWPPVGVLRGFSVDAAKVGVVSVGHVSTLLNVVRSMLVSIVGSSSSRRLPLSTSTLASSSSPLPSSFLSTASILSTALFDCCSVSTSSGSSLLLLPFQKVTLGDPVETKKEKSLRFWAQLLNPEEPVFVHHYIYPWGRYFGVIKNCVWLVIYLSS